MRETASFPTSHAAMVDWSAPDLERLLSGSTDWTLDNRHSSRLYQAVVYDGIGATHAGGAMIAWEDERKIVLLVLFDLHAGDPVKIHKRVGDAVRVIPGDVLECRPGRRAGDQERGVRVAWVEKRYPRA